MGWSKWQCVKTPARHHVPSRRVDPGALAEVSAHRGDTARDADRPRRRRPRITNSF
jgi:hypothetical protein